MVRKTRLLAVTMADGRDSDEVATESFLFNLFELVLLVASFVRRDMHDNRQLFCSNHEDLPLIRYALVSAFQKYFKELKLCVGYVIRVGAIGESSLCGPEYHFYKKGSSTVTAGRLKAIPHVWLIWRKNKQKIFDIMGPGTTLDMWSPSVFEQGANALWFEEASFDKAHNAALINRYFLIIEGYVLDALSQIDKKSS